MNINDYRVTTTTFYGIRIAGFKGEAWGEQINEAWYPCVEVNAEGEFGGRYRLPPMSNSYLASEDAKTFLRTIFAEWCETIPNGQDLLYRVRAILPD